MHRTKAIKLKFKKPHQTNFKMFLDKSDSAMINNDFKQLFQTVDCKI